MDRSIYDWKNVCKKCGHEFKDDMRTPLFIEPYCFSCGSTDLRNPSFIESRHISFFAYVCRRCGAIIRRDKPITKHQKRKTRKTRKIRYKKTKKRSKKNS